MAESSLLQGTLELLVLKTLSLEPLHGWGIAQRIRQMSRDVVQVNQGSLYPALQRMMRKGWIRSEWRSTENNRRARYYMLTAAGQKQLAIARAEFERSASAIFQVLSSAGGRREPSHGSEGAGLRTAVPPPYEELDLQEELRFHLEQETAANIERGMSPQQARRQAALQFGGVDRKQERDAQGTRFLDDVYRDARYTFCPLARPPSFALTAVLVLASRHRRSDSQLLRRTGGGPTSAVVHRTRPSVYAVGVAFGIGGRSGAGVPANYVD